eukprot:GFYU01008924.1.p1 GENE.GFYU01008924.1~~GFYU01008924.1.p1  ORF type:complete len:199 (-),score=11.35 GFYU01008924.1:227-823(-)
MSRSDVRTENGTHEAAVSGAAWQAAVNLDDRRTDLNNITIDQNVQYDRAQLDERLMRVDSLPMHVQSQQGVDERSSMQTCRDTEARTDLTLPSKVTSDVGPTVLSDDVADRTVPIRKPEVQEKLAPVDQGKSRNRWFGPYPIVAIPSRKTVKVALPLEMKTHPVVNTDVCRPFYRGRTTQLDDPVSLKLMIERSEWIQ